MEAMGKKSIAEIAKETGLSEDKIQKLLRKKKSDENKTLDSDELKLGRIDIKDKINKFFFIVVIASIVRFIPVLFGANFLDLYEQQAIPVLKGLNIYKATSNVFPYSPVSMFLPALCAYISLLLKVPFYIIMKAPAIIGDAFIAGSLYLIISEVDSGRNGYIWGLFYALNPISLLITSFHGNLISIPTLFMFLSYAVLLFHEERNYRLSALLLGLAIGFRGFPILLLPFFLLKLNQSFSKRLEYLAYAVIPTALSFLPFLILDYQSVLKEVFAYSGFTDYGIIAILRGIYSIKHNILAYGLPDNIHLTFLAFTKTLFLIIYFLLIPNAKKFKLIDLIVLVFLLFYFIYGGIGSQYFIWLLPFIFLTKDKWLKFYMLLCTMALAGFYYVYHPRILFGSSSYVKLPLRILLYNEVFWIGLLWILCGFWAVRLFFTKEKRERFV